MRFFKVWVGFAMVAALVLGITLGNFVVAGGLLPGSSQDPLVSESYIEEKVKEKTTELEAQIKSLEKEVSELNLAIDKFDAQFRGTSNFEKPKTSPVAETKPIENVTTLNKKMTVNAVGGVNIRSGPSTNFNVLSGLGHGAKVDVVSKSGEWYEIQIDSNKTGWVHSKFINE